MLSNAAQFSRAKRISGVGLSLFAFRPIDCCVRGS